MFKLHQVQMNNIRTNTDSAVCSQFAVEQTPIDLDVTSRPLHHQY